jgi:hypothetical protein
MLYVGSKDSSQLPVVSSQTQGAAAELTGLEEEIILVHCTLRRTDFGIFA